MRTELFVSVFARLVPAVQSLVSNGLYDDPGVTREDALNSTAGVGEHLNFEDVLVDSGVEQPNVSSGQAEHEVDGMVQRVGLDKADGTELLCVIDKTVLRRQVSLLVLQLQVLSDAPVVVDSI